MVVAVAVGHGVDDVVSASPYAGAGAVVATLPLLPSYVLYYGNLPMACFGRLVQNSCCLAQQPGHVLDNLLMGFVAVCSEPLDALCPFC